MTQYMDAESQRLVRAPSGTSAVRRQSRNIARAAILVVIEIKQPSERAGFARPYRARDPGSGASRPIAPRAEAPRPQNTEPGDNYERLRFRALIVQLPRRFLSPAGNQN